MAEPLRAKPTPSARTERCDAQQPLLELAAARARAHPPFHAPLAPSRYARAGVSLSELKCARFGLLVLEALRALRPLGASACAHVHCGNLFLSGRHELLRLAEWEQGVRRDRSAERAPERFIGAAPHQPRAEA